MAVIIKKMKLPETCEACNLESYCSLWVDARRMSAKDESRYATIRHLDCPLEEISEQELYDQGVKDGAALAAMHGSDATSQELAEQYFKGMEEGYKKGREGYIKKGQWVTLDTASEICTCCEKIFSISSLFMMGGNDEPPYCPNCGAEMINYGKSNN